MRPGLALLAGLAIAGTTAAAHASTPANIKLVAPLLNDEPIVTWTSVVGAEEYRLTGTIYALRVNANDAFCTPPLMGDNQTLTLDEAIDGSVTLFELPLPEMPEEDAWFFAETRVTLEAFDSEGITLARGEFAQRMPDVGGVLSCETPTPQVVLPPAGSGGARVAAPGPIALLLAAAVLATIGALALRRALRG